MSGSQQSPRPCDPEEAFEQYEKELIAVEKELLNITTNIVKGLLEIILL